MHISLHKIGKKFNREWIFRNIDFEIPSGTRIAILGSNGSGKSTLLQVLSGILSPSEGSTEYRINETEVPIEEVFQYFTIASPYLELVEEMTLIEMIVFHFSFKGRLQELSNTEIINLLGLEKSTHKEIRHFSSGMKQRLKLALAVLSDVQCILLDEPCSNLDKQSISWYQNLLNTYVANRTLIICSNQEYEYEICDKSLSIMDYKSV
ncbi:MAG: ATP-binding cassette domain-containing protein [Sphingobacteriales bacterium]|nr:ATP-binding cassette domain-containing protein [Sphingobacteriales bacterium]